MVPVIVSVLTPGVTTHAFVTGSLSYEAAGTVISPAVVENTPVVSSYVYWVPAVNAVPLNVAVRLERTGLNVSVTTTPVVAFASAFPEF